jgi:hypothetical protein
VAGNANHGGDGELLRTRIRLLPARSPC